MICEDPQFAFNCSELPAFVELLDNFRRRPGREAGADQVVERVGNSLHAAFAAGKGMALPFQSSNLMLFCGAAEAIFYSKSHFEGMPLIVCYLLIYFAKYF